MSEEIKPALTPEEWVAQSKEGWVNQSVERVHGGFGGGELRRDLFTRMWYDSVDGIRVTVQEETGYEEDITIPFAAYHALAALCLHGQPFGFTDGDTFVIGYARRLIYDRILALRAQGTAVDLELASGMEDVYSYLGNLIARIAALLPPEDVDDNEGGG